MRASLLCLLWWLLAGQLAAQPSNPDAPLLRQLDELLVRRRYETAFRLLQPYAADYRRPTLMLKAADVALHYYWQQRDFRRFAFRDVPPTQRLDSLRLQPTDSLPYHFPIEERLDSLHHRYPENYRIAKALADYYFELQQCACTEAELNEDDLFRRMERHYQAAHSHGHGDYRSYYALGYALMRLGKFEQSAVAYERALKLRPNYALAHFQLAYDYLELKRLTAARDEARQAVALFEEPQLRADAAFLLADLERRLLPPATKSATTAVASDSATLAYQQRVVAEGMLPIARAVVPPVTWANWAVWVPSVDALAPHTLPLPDWGRWAVWVEPETELEPLPTVLTPGPAVAGPLPPTLPAFIRAPLTLPAPASGQP